MAGSKAFESGQSDEARVFYETLGAANLAPLWQMLSKLVPEAPATPAQPAIWRYAKVRDLLLQAGRIIDAESAERRVLVLENPAMPGQARTTGSLYGGLQLLLPGERARAHRHVASALRFVIDGVGAWTSVNGEKTNMRPGDFIVTPTWTWHGHGNDGAEPVIWLDGLDIHLVNLLDAGFRQDASLQPALGELPIGASSAEYGANLLPINAPARTAASPIFNYPYARTRAALHDIVKFRTADPHDGYRLRHANPLNGDWAIATIATWMQLLPAGFETLPKRSTDGSINVIVEGDGFSMIDGVRLDWAEKDVFVTPAWAQVTHHPRSSAIIFGASDRAAQEKLGLWREWRGAHAQDFFVQTAAF